MAGGRRRRPGPGSRILIVARQSKGPFAVRMKDGPDTSQTGVRGVRVGEATGEEATRAVDGSAKILQNAAFSAGLSNCLTLIANRRRAAAPAGRLRPGVSANGSPARWRPFGANRRQGRWPFGAKRGPFRGHPHLKMARRRPGCGPVVAGNNPRRRRRPRATC